MSEEPWRPPDGEPPDFGRRSSVGHRVQVWFDHTRRRDRVVRFMGRCLICLIPTWRFDDGENDPRGVLGDHAYWPVTIEYRGFDYEITTCSTCANIHERYLRALKVAEAELDIRRLDPDRRNRLIKIRKE